MWPRPPEKYPCKHAQTVSPPLGIYNTHTCLKQKWAKLGILTSTGLSHILMRTCAHGLMHTLDVTFWYEDGHHFFQSTIGACSHT